MKAFLRFLGFLVAVVVAAYVIGAGMPQNHSLSRSKTFAAPPERVWSAILSIRQLPYDRSDLRSIDRGASTQPQNTIEVVGGPVSLSWETFHPPHDFVVKTVDPDVSYGGTWQVTLTPDGNGLTKVTVDEEAVVRGRLLRFAIRTFGFDDVIIEGIFRAVKRKIVVPPQAGG